jgi:hypothetical protein
MQDLSISYDLLMQAAKYIQNHKIRCSTIIFSTTDEVIKFKDVDDTVVAEVDYKGGKSNARSRR